MHLKFDDENVVYTKIVYDWVGKCFILVSAEGTCLECENFLELDDEYNLADYSYEILNTKTLNRENDIFQVYDKQVGVRMGWIFPIQALVSNDHDHVDDIYFLKYAYVAMYFLLHAIDEEDRRSSRDFLRITDFYPDGAIVLILCKSNCSSIKDFCIEDYVVDLFRYGYSFSPDIVDTQRRISIEKKINVRRISEYIKDKIFIVEVFKSLLVRTTPLPLAKFHMLYQIIELLIGDIFSYEFIGFNNKIGEDTDNLFDTKDDLQKIVGEKYRVKQLFSRTYSHVDGIITDRLLDVCNEILRASGKKERANVAESLYAVRCLVFHSYGSIPAESRKKVDEINLIFEEVVIELLITFHIPKHLY